MVNPLAFTAYPMALALSLSKGEGPGATWQTCQNVTPSPTENPLTFSPKT